MASRWDSEEDERSAPKEKKRRLEKKLSARVLQEEDVDSKDSRTQVEEMRNWSILHGCRNLTAHYEKLNKISEGSFGCVFRGRKLDKDGRIVAIKLVKIPAILQPEGFPTAALREISALLDLRHPNLIEVLEVCVDTSRRVFMVMEYVEHELKVLLQNNKPEFSLSEKKRLMLQVLEGVKYIHSRKYVHRDLKTANLLYTNDGRVKICDFGLAKKLVSDQHTVKVATLWYRAPECIIGERDYGAPLDMWAVGCIMGEILTGQPLFVANTEVEALHRICGLAGTPLSVEDWPLLAKCEFTLPKLKASWREKFPLPSRTFLSGSVTENGLDLLKGLLEWDAEKRLTAEEALKHPFFSESPQPQSLSFMPSAPETNMSAHRRRDSSEEEDGKKTTRQRVNVSRYLESMVKATTARSF